MRGIFISYRRADAEGQAGRLFRDLCDRFGRDAVFIDVAGMEKGRDFRRVLERQLNSCSVLLTIIGKDWLAAVDEHGNRRLDDPRDFTRMETAAALKRDIPVIPVLVGGARMPREDELPEDLKELVFRDGVEITHARWDSDVQELIKALVPYVEHEIKDNPPPPPRPSPQAGSKKLTVISVGAAALAIVVVAVYLVNDLVGKSHRAGADADRATAELTRPGAIEKAKERPPAPVTRTPVPSGSKVPSLVDLQLSGTWQMDRGRSLDRHGRAIDSGIGSVDIAQVANQLRIYMKQQVGSPASGERRLVIDAELGEDVMTFTTPDNNIEVRLQRADPSSQQWQMSFIPAKPGKAEMPIISGEAHVSANGRQWVGSYTMTEAKSEPVTIRWEMTLSEDDRNWTGTLFDKDGTSATLVFNKL
jgi:hypothetical protein